MSDKQFFDTNVLFYAYDTSDPAKQAIAENLVRQAAADASGVVSIQVLGEFFHATVTRKAVLDAHEAERAIRALSHLQVVDIDLLLVQAAIGYHQQYQLRYWDALILAAAKRAVCVELLTEDFTDGQDYDGVRARNPFRTAPAP
jgi:predicted nucleic acid-binding protein